MKVRETWRLALLLVLIVGSTFALFGPGVGTGNAALGGDGTATTNLAYGIELDGGTRLRAPVAGWTAENVTVDDPGATTDAVASELGLDAVDVVTVDTDGPNEPGVAIEMRARNLNRSAVESALTAAGVTLDGSVTVRQGVTGETRREMADVVQQKLRESAFSGGTAGIATALGEEYYVVAEAPNRGREELRELLSERGVVRVEAFYPADNGTYVNETVLRRDDLDDIGAAQTSQRGVPFVPLTVTDAYAGTFADRMVAAGFIPENADLEAGEREPDIDCGFQGYESGNNTGRCLLVVRDGQVVNSFGMVQDLAASFTDGDFEANPVFRMTVPTSDEARQLAIHLRAGALPAPLDFEQMTLYTVDPALAEQFKSYSAITGLLAVLAVSLAVYLRYGDVRVAAPMVVTALSEVWLLLGFAAVVGYSVNLSVIAGFIAVIGTGVDDLIIIADEVMSEGEVNSSRVFKSRFRKALWVIGAAAATTILAMSPLAVLSLGDLQGFALVTILGVLIGVLITRPAYGDILRSLLTDR